MKRLRRVLFVLSFLPFCIQGVVQSAEPANLVPNPSFEDGGSPPTGWLFQENALPEITVAMDDTVARTGSRSFRVTHTGADDWEEAAIYSQSVPIPSGLLLYELNVWTRVESGKRVRAALFWRDGNGDLIPPGSTDVIDEYTGSPITHDWESQSAIRLAAPFNAESVDVYVYGQGPGTYWFDDVEFKFFRPAPFPVFPDLAPDGVLDRMDAISLPGHYAPGEKGFSAFGTEDLPGFITAFRTRGALPAGLPFREFFPLHNGDDYLFRSDDYPASDDRFSRQTVGPLSVHDREAYRIRVHDTVPPDPEAEQSAVLSATGPVEFLQFIIENEITYPAMGVVVPPQTLDLDPGLLAACEKVEVGDIVTSAADTTVDIVYNSFPINNVAATITLESAVRDAGDAIVLQDDGSTDVTDTLVLATRASISGSGTIPFELNFDPASGITWYVRGVGMVQIQEIEGGVTPGATFPLRSATVAGETFP